MLDLKGKTDILSPHLQEKKKKSGRHFSEILYVTHAQIETAPRHCGTLLDVPFTPHLQGI